MNEQRAASQQQENVLKLRLEDTAQKSHELILREREEAIKTEAEERHALGIQSFQQQVSHLTSQLQASQQQLSEKEAALIQARGAGKRPSHSNEPQSASKHSCF